LARYDEAIDQYRAALEQIPGNSELRLNLALAFYKKGAFASALDQLGEPNQKSPNDLGIAILLGDCYSRLGQRDKAISLLLPFETNNPNNLDRAWVLGSALITADHPADGLKRERAMPRRLAPATHRTRGSLLPATPPRKTAPGENRSWNASLNKSARTKPKVISPVLPSP
jgi:tetratricopeptide (TPR) repeat protein